MLFSIQCTGTSMESIVWQGFVTYHLVVSQTAVFYKLILFRYSTFIFGELVRPKVLK